MNLLKTTVFGSVILCIMLSANISAQSPALKLILKAGVSEYGSVQGLQVSGGSGPGVWYIGPIVGAGVEAHLNNNWHTQFTVEFSYNKYGEEVHHTESLERGKNRVIDLMANLKKRWGWFYIISGAGYSFQKNTATYSSGYLSSGAYFHYLKYEASSSNVFTGLFGFGVEFELTRSAGIFLEGTWRLRKYVTPVLQLGISQKL